MAFPLPWRPPAQKSLWLGEERVKVRVGGKTGDHSVSVLSTPRAARALAPRAFILPLELTVSHKSGGWTQGKGHYQCN